MSREKARNALVNFAHDQDEGGDGKNSAEEVADGEDGIQVDLISNFHAPIILEPGPGFKNKPGKPGERKSLPHQDLREGRGGATRRECKGNF